MSQQQSTPSYADKVKQSLEQTADLGQAPGQSAPAEQSIAVSNAEVLGDRPSISEKSKGPGAVYHDPAHKQDSLGDVSEPSDLYEQIRYRSGPNYMPEAETQPGRSEVGSEEEGTPSLATQAKEKLRGANESLKSSVTRSQEKLNEALSGGIQQKAGQAWGQTKETLMPDAGKPGIMEQLTTKIAEGSKKVTETAQSMTDGLKSSLGLGRSESEKPQQMIDEERRVS